MLMHLEKEEVSQRKHRLFGHAVKNPFLLIRLFAQVAFELELMNAAIAFVQPILSIHQFHEIQLVESVQCK